VRRRWNEAESPDHLCDRVDGQVLDVARSLGVSAAHRLLDIQRDRLEGGQREFVVGKEGAQGGVDEDEESVLVTRLPRVGPSAGWRFRDRTGYSPTALTARAGLAPFSA
jgi:hypothetical protein